MATIGPTVDSSVGYWPNSITDTQVVCNDLYMSPMGNQAGLYDVACRSDDSFNAPVLASKIDCIQVN